MIFGSIPARTSTKTGSSPVGVTIFASVCKSVAQLVEQVAVNHLVAGSSYGELFNRINAIRVARKTHNLRDRVPARQGSKLSVTGKVIPILVFLCSLFSCSHPENINSYSELQIGKLHS